MSFRLVIAGLVIALVSFSSSAAEETTIELTAGKPSQKEFLVAAKRALFSRNYEIWSVNPDVVIGKYKKRVEVALILKEDAVVIRYIDSGGVQSETIRKWMRNLNRDLVYELAEYALPPVTVADPAKIAALLSDNAPTVKSNRSYDLAGQYASDGFGGDTVTLTQKGNKIEGSFGSSGQIWAEIEGDLVRFDYLKPGGSTGKGVWEISADATELRGVRGTSWNLKRLQ